MMIKALSRNILSLILTFFLLLYGCSQNNTTRVPFTQPALEFTPTAGETDTGTSSKITTNITATALTATPAVTPEAVHFSSDTFQLIINAYRNEMGTRLVNEYGETLRKTDNLYGDITFSLDPCFFYGFQNKLPEGNGIQINTVSMQWEVVNRREIFFDSEYPYEGRFHVSASPDLKWISFVRPSGDNGFDERDSSNLYLELMQVNDQNGLPNNLTPRGGSGYQGAGWSPDSRYLAFSDRDENGIVQIQILDLQSQLTTQLTHFGEEFRDQNIRQIQFSPNGNWIAFISWREQGLGKIGLIDLEDYTLKWMQLPGSLYGPSMSTFWWQRDSRQILLLLDGEDRQGQYSNTLIAWYDVRTGELVQSFPKKGQGGYHIEKIFPLKDIDRVGFLAYQESDNSGAKYWMFDRKDGTLVRIDLPFLDASPVYFVIASRDISLDTCK